MCKFQKVEKIAKGFLGTNSSKIDLKFNSISNAYEMYVNEYIPKNTIIS